SHTDVSFPSDQLRGARGRDRKGSLRSGECSSPSRTGPSSGPVRGSPGQDVCTSHGPARSPGSSLRVHHFATYVRSPCLTTPPVPKTLEAVQTAVPSGAAASSCHEPHTDLPRSPRVPPNH